MELQNENAQPLVSVLLPVYNVEKYLPLCLETIIKQTYHNLEIILIDDGSTDKSLQIIREYAVKDSRIHFISRENRGLIPTRLQELQMFRGKYIAIIDSDDWVEPDYIEQMISVALRYDADVVRCGDIIEFVAEGRKRLYSKAKTENVIIDQETFKEEMLVDFCENSYYNSVHSELIKSSLIDSELLDKIEQRKTVAIGEDIIINCEIYKKTNLLVSIPNNLYHYRKNPNSMMMEKIDSKKLRKRLEDLLTVSKAMNELADEKGYRTEYTLRKRLIKDIDECTNLFFKSNTDYRTKKKAINFIRKFIAENGLLGVDERAYKYLFDSKHTFIILLKKNLFVSIPYFFKENVKTIMTWFNRRRINL